MNLLPTQQVGIRKILETHFPQACAVLIQTVVDEIATLIPAIALGDYISLLEEWERNAQVIRRQVESTEEEFARTTGITLPAYVDPDG